MITSLLGEMFLREIPKHLITNVSGGQSQVYGSVIRNVANGQIQGFLQEAAPVARLLNPVTGVPSLLLDAGGLVQGEVLRQKMNALQSAVDTLQHLGIANLAVSVTGIGVTVAAVTVLNAKINRVQRSVERMEEQLSAKLDQLLHQPIQNDLAELRAVAKDLDEAWSLGAGAAERRWEEAARAAVHLQERFDSRATHQLDGRTSQYEHAEPLIDAVAVANGLRVSALAACNAVVAARNAASEGAQIIDRLTGNIAAADLARNRMAQSSVEAGSPEWEVARIEHHATAMLVAKQIREREAAVATRAAPLVQLERMGIHARDWLEAARQEKDAPVLLLEAEEANL